MSGIRIYPYSNNLADNFSYGYFSVVAHFLYITKNYKRGLSAPDLRNSGAVSPTGNRIRKTVEKYEGGDPDPVHENTGDNPGWHLVSDEFYVRDVSGKEIAIYSGTNIVQWNIWGLDNVGKIPACQAVRAQEC